MIHSRELQGKMNFEISNEGALDRIALGESRAQIREGLGEFTTFQRVPGGPEIDDFTRSGVQVTYGDTGTAEFIEISAPSQVAYAGVEMIGASPADIYQDLTAAGAEVEEDGQGAIVDGKFGIYADEETVLAVSIGE